jgi:uncharacterized protein (TIGR03083 family)
VSADHLAHLEDACDRIAAVLASAGPDVDVPSCPGWTLGDLVAHHGGIHRWARAAVLEGHGRHDPGPAPSGDALLAWYQRGAADLLATLRTTDPEAACWTLWPPAVAAFWRRRQCLEAVVHAWDAEAAVGRPRALDPDLAADGIDEVVSGFLPRQVRLGRIPRLPDAVALVAGDATWVVGEGEPAGAVHRPAPDLLLLLWRRLDVADPGRFTVSGNAVAVTGVLGLALTP